MDGNGRNDIERGKKYRKTRGGNLQKWMNVKNQQRAIAVCSEMEKTERDREREWRKRRYWKEWLCKHWKS